MTSLEYIDRYGEPKGWELASVILEQIEDFRRATRILTQGPNPRPPWALTRAAGLTDQQYKDYLIETAERRVKLPIIDLDAARRQIAENEPSGGEMYRFIRGTDEVPFDAEERDLEA